MNSLVYLARTQLKNNLKELLRKPARLVPYLLVIVAMGATLFSALASPRQADEIMPLFWLKGIYVAFLTLFLVMGVQKGLTAGDAIFEMSDVNLLFVSPVNPRAILLYGLARLTSVAFFAGFFILFQGSTVSGFGVGFAGLLLIFFTFMLNTIALSILSLVIYSATNSNPRRKRVVRFLAVLAFVPAALFFLVQLLSTQSFLDALPPTIDSLYLSLIPLVGWIATGTITLLEGNLLGGLGWLTLVVVAVAGMLCYLLLSRSDYYEDVLVATETAFERKRAAREGDLQNTAATNGKVKVSKTGIGGAGASALLYKHLRETFRQNRFGFFGLNSVVAFLCILAAAIFKPEALVVPLVLQILMWIQIFMIGTGRGLKEVYLHYIYLIPEPPFSKIIWSNLELVFRTLLESVLYFVVPGLIVGEHPLIVLGSIVVYTLFALLLLGVNFVSMRFSEADLSQGILLMLYFLMVVLAMLPGLVPALLVGFTIGGTGGVCLALLILSVWELIAALICFALSKNVLHRCDMPSAKGRNA